MDRERENITHIENVPLLSLSFFQGITKQREELERRLPQLESQIQFKSSEIKRMKEIEIEIKSYEKEIQKIKMSCGGLEAEIKSLEDKIANAGGIELKTQNTKVKGLISQVRSLSSLLLSLFKTYHHLNNNKLIVCFESRFLRVISTFFFLFF